MTTDLFLVFYASVRSLCLVGSVDYYRRALPTVSCVKVIAPAFALLVFCPFLHTMSQKGPFLLENKTRDAGKARIELYQEGKEYLANDRFAKELQEWKRKESEYKYELL